MEEASKGRFRFSRRSIVVAIVLVALSVLHLRASRELSKVRSVLTLVRIQLGEIVVDDPTKVHVFARPTHVDDEYEWRLYVPPGGQFKLLTEFNNLAPEAGLPGNHLIDAQRLPQDVIDSGLYTIRFCQRQTFDKSGGGASWTAALSFLSDESYGRLYGGWGPIWFSPGQIPWAENDWVKKVNTIGKHETVVAYSTEEIVLFEMRCASPDSPNADLGRQKPCLLLHLVPVKTP